MKRILLLSFLVIALTWMAANSPDQRLTSSSVSHTDPLAATLVIEQPSNLWFEGPFIRASVSADEKWALFSLDGDVHLFSLPNGHAEPDKLRGGMDGVAAAAFCGSDLIRLAKRGEEIGLFFPGPKEPILSKLPRNAIPVCSPDSHEMAFYKIGGGIDAGGHSVFVGTLADYREYPVDGNILSLAFSPDGTTSIPLHSRQTGNQPSRALR